jgi:hypothetical protein
VAKYGTFLYGSSVLYGTSTINSTIWLVEVDWDGDGIFDGTNEAGRATNLYVKRGRENFLSISSGGVAQGFEPIRPGTASITVDNSDGRYNAYNTSSPLYGYLRPGALMRIRMINTSDGTPMPVFVGRVTDIQPYGSDRKKAVIKAEDGLRFLADADISVALSANIGIDDAIDSILTNASWPSTWPRNIESVTDVVPFWWAEGKALGEITNLSDSELGIFFHGADGTATYHSRHHSVDPTYTLTSADLLKDISYPQPWETQRNKIKITIHPRAAQASAALWTANTVSSLTPGDSITVWATYSYGSESPVPATSVISPVATTDYLMNAQADGLGANLTANLSVTMTDFGTTAKLVLTNTHATQTGYITLLKVRGSAVASTSEIKVIDSSGDADRALVMDLAWVQSANTASDFTNYLLGWLGTAKIFPTVVIEARPDLQFNFDIQDTVGLTIPTLQIDDDYKIGMIEHRWSIENGQATETTITFEPKASFTPGSFWTFPTTLGTTSILGF